jgi:hypothetical protein
MRRMAELLRKIAWSCGNSSWKIEELVFESGFRFEWFTCAGENAHCKQSFRMGSLDGIKSERTTVDKLKFLVHGKWRELTTGKYMDVYNPMV